MKLLHQCGHCTTWNIDSFRDDHCGDGLILSPVHERKVNLEKHLPILRRSSLFDPQFYLPNSQKQKLHTYDFFPEVVSSGFSTIDYSAVARDAAKLCIDFQLRLDYESVVIPARHFEQMDPKYTDKQDAYTVNPFLHEYTKRKSKKKLILTLPLTSHMVESAEYRTTILNWVTRYTEITGVYLIIECDRNTKQIANEAFLDAMLVMLTELKAADLSVTVGYTNTESLLYTLAGDLDVTFGAYENTRMFSIDKFLLNEEERRGPKPRIYLPGLLNWVQFDQAKELRKTSPEIWKQVYTPTKWAEEVFNLAKEPHFSQPALYKHYFHCFSQQFITLKALSRKDRYHQLRNWIKKGIELYDQIAEIPIEFEKHGAGGHLQPWLNVINRYYAAYLKS